MSSPGGAPPHQAGPSVLPPRVEDFRLRTSSEGSMFRGHEALSRGAKRMAVSPPHAEERTELGPPPLSDADLQSIKDMLAEHDYTFASINAVSKESAAKKKELEEVISAYRRAVDRIMMAYVQVKAERDTTSKIWRMMRMSGKDDPECVMSSEMSDAIRESTNLAVREVFGEWRSSMVLPEAMVSVRNANRSYADTVSAAGAGVLRSSLAGRDPGSASRQSAETIEVIPREYIDSKLPDSSAMCKAVLSSIRPAESGIKIDRVIKGKSKSVRIVAARDDLDKLQPMLDKIGMDVRRVDKLNPRLIVRDIPVDINKQHFIKDLIKQNLDGVNEEDVKLVYWFPAKNRQSTSAVVEVSPGVRSKLLNQARVYLGWSSCRVADHVRVLQCYKCLNFGHVAKDCRAASDVCGHCCGEHESRLCPNKASIRKCHNCVSAKIVAVDHSAFDTFACPILQRRLKDRMRMIKY